MRRNWLPAVAVIVQLLCLAPTLAADDWVRVVPKETDDNLSLAVVGEKSEEPVVRLGIKGRDGNGWYPLSKVSVAR